MFPFFKAGQKLTIMLLIITFAGITADAQKTMRPQPVWWFGESGAINFNYYRGTTQMLNNNITVPTAFHKGRGVKPYASILVEYRPKKVFGAMLNVAFDNRGGKFNGVDAPCNCPASLSTNMGYLVIEPSLRIAPFANAFYIFAGPTIGFNISRSFTYLQQKQTDVRGEWSDVRKTIFSGQVGAGIDIPISPRANATQLTLSPFVSFQTDFGHNPRSTESWSLATLRTGIALKLGTGPKPPTPITPAIGILAPPPPVTIVEKSLQFSVRGPKVVPLNRQVKETFPLRNSVFFDMGSTDIPTRYVLLSQPDAAAFKETQLQQGQPINLNYGRSARQMAVYYNILNIVGDRLRTNPQSTIELAGASDKNPVEGKLLAENVKAYLVTNFGIDGARISTEGRDKPLIPSEQPGGTKELPLLREGDRRVDIVSTSPELMLQVGGTIQPFLRPVEIEAIQVDPMDSHVVFTADGANDMLASWSVNITDEKGVVQHYGPYTGDQASVSGKTILGSNTQGNYSIEMVGQTKTGQTITKQSSVSLMKVEDVKQQGMRYSILFDFDKSKSIDSYEKFLTDIVTPLIPENGTVIIHGHTDIIGDEKYNLSLSRERANGAQKIIERALLAAGKQGVKFETYGFGEDENLAPFENDFPEKRFYNRTVIIDIIPAK